MGWHAKKLNEPCDKDFALKQKIFNALGLNCWSTPSPAWLLALVLGAGQHQGAGGDVPGEQGWGRAEPPGGDPAGCHRPVLTVTLSIQSPHEVQLCVKARYT